MMDRGNLDVERLLKIVLVLVVLWLLLELVTDVLMMALGPLTHVLGLVIVVLIVLWLLDKI